MDNLNKVQPTESAMQQNEAILSLFYDLPFIGMAITSPETQRWVRFNDRLCEILGYSREELPRITWTEITHPDDLDLDVAEFERVMRGESEGYVMDKRFIRKDGRIIDATIDVKCVRKPDRAVDFFVATVQDISDRKLAEAKQRQIEKALAESENRYRQVVQTQIDFVLRSLPDTTITFANESLCRALGSSLDQIIGQKWIDFVDPTSLKDTLHKISILSPINPIFSIDNPNHRNDGQMGWTQWINQGIFDDCGQLIEIQFAGRDITELKRVEQSLRESETRFRNIVENVPGAILQYLLRPDGTDSVLYINNGCYHLWEIEGYIVEQSAKCLWDMIHPDDLPATYKSVMTALQTLEPWACEYRIITPSGKMKWLQAWGSPMRHSNGDVVLDTVIVDVSDRKLAEIALQQLNNELELRIEQRTLDLQASEAKFRGFFDFAPIGIAVANIQTYRFEIVNQAFCQLLNYSEPELLACSSCLTISVSEDWELERPYAEKIMSGEINSYQIEKRYIKKNGEILIGNLTATALRDQDGNITHLIGMVQDITQRKQAEDLLLKSDTHLKAAQRIGKLGSWEFDLQTGKVTWSEEVFHIFGRDPAIGTPTYAELQKTIHPDDWEYFNRVVQQAIATAKSYDVDYRICWADGTLLYVSARGEIICDSMGQAIQIIGTVIDLTDRKLAEQQLQNATDRLTLALKSAAIGIWEWDIAHNCLIWDERTFELYGVTPDPLLDAFAAWASRVHPDDRVIAETAVQLALSGTKDYETEFRIMLPDGNIRFLKAYALVQNNEVGEPQRMVGINFDITDRKLAEKTLLKSDTHLKIAQRIGKVGSWEYEINTGKLTWSDEIFRIYGLEPSEYPPKYDELKRYIHPDDWDHFHQTVQNAINLAQSYDLEHRLIQPSGTLIYVLARGEMIYDASGQVTHIIGTAMDISDRKLAEQQLQNVTDRLTLALKSAAIGIWEWDVLHNILIWDKRMYELYGVNPAQSPNNYSIWVNCLHPSDREISEASVQLALQGIRDFDIEFRIVLPDHSIRYLKAFALVQRNDDGEPQYMIGINFDITDHKLAEAELTRNHDLREALFNESTDAMFLVDPQTVLTTDCNQTAVKLFEVSDPSELIGIEGHTLQRTQFSDQDIKDIQLVLDTQGFWSREIEYVSRQGRAFWGNLAVKPITVAGNTINLVRISDISDRKLAEAKIIQTALQLANTNRELESFSYSVSHDLRAPLRHMNGFVNALRQRLNTHQNLQDPKVTHYLQILENSSQKMAHLIDGLLTLSRYGRRPLDAKQVSIRDLVDDAIEVIRTDPSYNPLLEFAIGDLPNVIGDPTLLQQVFRNLISNAVKFSRHQPQPRIEIDSLPDTTIRIKDNGAGFQMEYADKLFGAFQRLHNETEFEGNGIGLAIVQRIIQRHGGLVWAEGYPEQGATFFVKLSN